jgi:putative endopeptidase
VIRLVDAIVAAMANGIRELDWISEPTRAFASAKLDKLVRTVGYPDTWRSYDFVVERDDFAGNELRRNAFHHHRDLARAGKPVDRSEWHMPAFAVNAYYARALNHAALPAGILQPPYFGPDRSIAANLGGIGMMIGHELMHGFDDQGARYDAAGNLKDWWQPDDKAAFEARAACVADQYSTFEALPGQFVNGRLTLGENIADLGGVKAAFRAYRALRKDAAWSYIADGLTEDQQFFVAVAQAWCSKERPASLQRTLAADGHAPINFRIYGALRNLRELGEAFRCARGMPMHPIASCQVW